MCIVCNNFMLIDLIDSQWLRRKLTTLEKGNGFCFLDDLIWFEVSLHIVGLNRHGTGHYLQNFISRLFIYLPDAL